MCNKGIFLCCNLREIPFAGGFCSQQQLMQGLCLPTSSKRAWAYVLLSFKQRLDCLGSAELDTVAQM